MLLERTAEVEAPQHLIEAARSGIGGSVLVLGEPGVGETALLEAGLTPASEQNWRGLAAFPVPLRAE